MPNYYAVDRNQRHLFANGVNYRSYEFMGAHAHVYYNLPGFRFAVWAPEAQAVSVVGPFNGWDPQVNPMTKAEDYGLYLSFIPELQAGTLYKYAVQSADGQWRLKADPYARAAETPPGTASVAIDKVQYAWGDQTHEKARDPQRIYHVPMTVYEVHLGSWKRHEDGSYYTYRELAHELPEYLVDMGYTHVEFMPVSEHPLDESWGYQVTGFFAPTARFGAPDDFRYLIDRMHQQGIHVLLDWVPGHFCKDDHGLRLFDGTAVYEHADPIKGEHSQWGTNIFNLGRPQVRQFLISNAIYWLREFHIDGLRVDGVSSMLYLDFGREDGQPWIPNPQGGNQDLEAVDFLRELNRAVSEQCPNRLMIAEEATNWPGVTRSIEQGGLGFTYKWNMGWMNDTMSYISTEAHSRGHVHQHVSFSMVYAFSENFILPLSHDEVVHAKLTLINKMPGDYWQKFAGLRLLYAYQYAHPGKKLLFMGQEIAPFMEWRFYEQLEWHMLQYPAHDSIRTYVRALNRLYLEHPALWEDDFGWLGFTWIDPDDRERSVFSWIRHSRQEEMVVVLNFTPATYIQHRIGLPRPGELFEVFNSDGLDYGGSGVTNPASIRTEPVPAHGHGQSAVIAVPPLGATYFVYRME